MRNLNARVGVNSDSVRKSKTLVGVKDFQEICGGTDDAAVVHDCTRGHVESFAILVFNSRLVDGLEEARADKPSEAVALTSAVLRKERVDNMATLADKQVRRVRVSKREDAPDQGKFRIVEANLEGTTTTTVARVVHIGCVDMQCGVIRVGFKSGLQGLDRPLTSTGRAPELNRFTHFQQVLFDKRKAVTLGKLEHLLAHGERTHVIGLFGTAAQDGRCEQLAAACVQVVVTNELNDKADSFAADLILPKRQ